MKRGDRRSLLRAVASSALAAPALARATLPNAASRFAATASIAAAAIGDVSSAQAAGESFAAWREAFKRRAAANGVGSRALSTLDRIEPNQRVVELDRSQPERRWTFAEYRERVISEQRIRRGRELLARHAALLDAVERRYGVQARFVVALWGLETSYGAITGDFDVLRSLATLAWDGRRRRLFEGELEAALRIVDAGEVEPSDMIGSWAGAMGQTQFMPSSFRRLAVDWDGDGRRDIWGSQGDVFASIANYLARSGWSAEYRWGRAVRAPEAAGPGGLDRRRPLAQWAQAGVVRADGGPLPIAPIDASLLRMDGGAAGEFLVYGNFHVLMKWNRSTYFGLTVTELADRLR